MMIMRGPGGFTGGKVIDALVSHLDVYPTICELAGIEQPSWLEGTSLMPLVRGERGQVHDEIFTEMTYHAAYQPQRAIRTERWKYIRRFDDEPRPVLANCDDSASKDLLVEHGWARRRCDREELYDLVFDPNEGHNVAADPANAPVLGELRAAARAHGWSSAATRSSTGRCRRRPGPRSTTPTRSRPREPTRKVGVSPDPTGAPSR